MMRISKSAPNLLKKAVTSFKSKAGAVRTKLMVLASLRRRMATVYALSRQIRALAVASDDGRGKQRQQARVEYHGDDKALTLRKPAADADHGGEPEQARRGGLFDEVAVFEEGYYCHGYPDDWTSSLFDDDGDYRYDDEDVCDDDHDDLDLVDDEPSVIEIIKSSRVAQGLEFNMDDEIDEACEMFIRRCRGRMNLSF
ncbi:hypothetical protein BS78_02G237800 [Paspalum vaginatum]|nr:hypothetical protein BS78_02G237800 [Paspalum vaginatum]